MDERLSLENIKPKNIILIVVTLAMLISLIGISLFYFSVSDILEEEVFNHLETAANSRTDHLETFLDEKKARAGDIGNDRFIADALRDLQEGKADSLEIKRDLRWHLLLHKLSRDKDIYEIEILDKNGKIVGTTNLEEEPGKDSSDDPVFMKGKIKPFVKDVFYDEEFNRNAYAFSAPIRPKGEFLGVVVVKMDLESLADITTDRTGLGETGEIYIVNDEGYLLTPSRFLKGENKGILIQVVDTENSRECLEGVKKHGVDKEMLMQHQKEGKISFEDYRGEDVLGTHAHIAEMKWCLLSEIDEAEVLEEPRRKLLVISLLILFITFILLGLIYFLFGEK